jgi:hypothetical protein
VSTLKTPAEAGALDVARVRADFPILASKSHGKPLVFLDSAASAQKPRAVIEAEARVYAECYANVHRGVYELSMKATDAYEGARATVQRFLNAASPKEIVFLRGTTEAINLVAGSYGRQHVRAGDEVLITGLEHHSNIVPWQLLCEAAGARLRVVPITDSGEVPLDALERLLSPRTGRCCRSRRSCASPMRAAFRCCSTPRSRRPACRSTCATSTATSWRSPATRPTGPRASAPCTRRPSTSRPCRPGRAAAT